MSASERSKIFALLSAFTCLQIIFSVSAWAGNKAHSQTNSKVDPADITVDSAGSDIDSDVESLLEKGDDLSNNADYKAAAEKYNSAYKLARSRHLVSDSAACLLRIGSMQLSAEHPVLAKKAFADALKSLKDGGHSSNEIAVFNYSIGNEYYSRSDNKVASEYLKSAMSLRRTTNGVDVADVIEAYAKTLAGTDNGAAIKLLKQALAIRKREGADIFQIQSIKQGLADAYDQAGNCDEAIAALKSVISDINAAPDHTKFDLFSAQLGVADQLRKCKQADAASKLLDQVTEQVKKDPVDADLDEALGYVDAWNARSGYVSDVDAESSPQPKSDEHTRRLFTVVFKRVEPFLMKPKETFSNDILLRLNNFGRLLAENKDYADAEVLHRRVLKDGKVLFGKKEFDLDQVVATYTDLENCLQQQDKAVEAAVLADESVAFQKKNNPDYSYSADEANAMFIKLSPAYNAEKLHLPLPVFVIGVCLAIFAVAVGMVALIVLIIRRIGAN